MVRTARRAVRHRLDLVVIHSVQAVDRLGDQVHLRQALGCEQISAPCLDEDRQAVGAAEFARVAMMRLDYEMMLREQIG